MFRAFFPLREPDNGNGNGGSPGGNTPPPSPPPPPAPPAPPPPAGPSKAELRAEVLKELGVSSAEEVKAAVELARAADEAKKSDAEKLATLKAELDAAKAAKTTLGEMVKLQAEGELAKLTQAQRDAVTKIAGDDPVKQLATVANLRPTWESQNQDPPKPPANTAPPAKDPKPGDTVQKTDKRAKFDALNAKDPFLAADFLFANPDALA